MLGATSSLLIINVFFSHSQKHSAVLVLPFSQSFMMMVIKHDTCITDSTSSKSKFTHYRSPSDPLPTNTAQEEIGNYV